MAKIQYKKKYKYHYVTHAAVTFETKYTPKDAHNGEFLSIDKKGLLTIKKGYAWDGATGWPDSKNVMRGSLIHDALYQLMREEVLPQSYRKKADLAMIKVCKEDGMWSITAAGIYGALRSFGASAARPDVLYAP